MTATPFVAQVSRARTGFLVLLGLGFVGAGGWLAGGSDPVMRGIGWAGVFMFGCFSVIGARQLLRTGPVMEVDARGVLWRRWSDTRIPWLAIERAGLRAMRGQTFLCLWLRDPAAYPAEGVMGRLAAANRALGFGDIALNVAGTDRSLDDLVAAVDAFVPIEGP